MSQARNNAGTTPDYEHWGLFASWTFEQATALSIHAEPEIVLSPECPESLRARYKLRLEVVNSHRFLAGRFPKTGCVAPSDFLSWAKTTGIDYPAALEKAVMARRGVITDWRLENEKLSGEIASLRSENESLVAALEAKGNDDKELTEAERKSVRKIIITMAVKKYSYNPSESRGRVSGQIVNDASELALKIDDNTVRSWLVRSAKLLPARIP
jgi:hypothetical protein